jgi:hypothetical protein
VSVKSATVFAFQLSVIPAALNALAVMFSPLKSAGQIFDFVVLAFKVSLDRG